MIRAAQFFSVVIVTTGLASSLAAAQDTGPNKANLIGTLVPTVVNVSVAKSEAAEPSPAMAGAAVPSADARQTIKTYVGSGFIIDPSGLVVTNFHVVENAFEITVMLSDGTRLPAKMESGSRLGDLALLKVSAGKPLPAAHWGNSDDLHVGDQVFAAGNPFGLGISVSAGIVSALNRDIMDSPYDDFIQTDAAINHGNSGGPMFDMQGNVIGVDSDILSPTSGSVGIGFAIPANSAKFVIDHLRTYGWVRPGWIGVKVQGVTSRIAAAMGMQQPEGSIVAWVMQNGPAGKAGLAVGDVILGFNGKMLSDERALLRDIATTPAGDNLALSVRRGSATQDIAVTAQEWPRNQWDAKDAPEMVNHPKIVIPRDLGLSLAAVDDDRKQTLGVMSDQKAVLVTAVLPASDPAENGVAAGDIILRVQDTPVGTPADVQAGIDAARKASRDYVLMLIIAKTDAMPGPKWVSLRLKGEPG